MGVVKNYLAPNDRTRIKAAAEHAEERVFPGSAVGQLIARELRAYLEMGRYFGGDGLSERLANEMIRMHNAGIVITDADSGVLVTFNTPRLSAPVESGAA